MCAALVGIHLEIAELVTRRRSKRWCGFYVNERESQVFLEGETIHLEHLGEVKSVVFEVNYENGQVDLIFTFARKE